MNGREIRINGMSRSGNHAIIDWILRQCSGRTIFLNCAEGKTNPFATCRPLNDGRPYRVFRDGAPAGATFDLAREAAGALTPKDTLVHSYEDSYLAHAFSRAFEEQHDVWVGPSAERFDVLVLRDPFNLFASRRAMGAALPRPTALRMWKQHARAALGRRGPLRRAPLVILYNRWAADAAYRRRVAETLGLVHSDRGIERVADCNGGSSFDGLAYDGQASDMAVTERWRSYVDDPEYLGLFDAEMTALSARLFGPPPRLPRPAGQDAAGAPLERPHPETPSTARSSVQSSTTRVA